MKTFIPFIAAVLLCQASLEGSVLYQNDFSGTTVPGRSEATLGDNSFAQAWSVTSSLVAESGNQYARYDFDIPTLPSNPNAMWYGGFYDSVGSFSALPAQWQLSFDISLNTLEPIEVNFVYLTGHLPYPTTTINYWVEPAGVGWQPVVVNQNTTSSTGFTGGGAPIAGMYLTIALASQDSQGNPLSISHIGTYDFLLDNVVLQSVPEPSALALCIMAGMLFGGIRRYPRSPLR
jgi:hypothetical protein